MNFNKFSKNELVEYCLKHNIKNYSNLKKIELINHIKNSINKKKGGKPSNTDLNPIIQITRHARSCNNEVKYRINLKEMDPSIVNRGIIQTIIFANINREEKFKSNYIYVSCLLRTWITAICLYSIGQNELILHISPYLKEKYTWLHKKSNFKIEKGNHPIPLSKSIPKFIKFLNNISKIIKKKEELSSNQEYITNFKLPNTIILKIEQNNELNNIKEIIIKKNGNTYNSPSTIYSNDYDPIMKKDNRIYYQTDGNISKFIHWLKNNYKNNIIESSSWFNFRSSTQKQLNKIYKKIHVVAHSNLMKEFLEGLNILNFLNFNNFEDDCKLNNYGYTKCTE